MQQFILNTVLVHGANQMKLKSVSDRKPATVFNNSWNNLYDLLMILDDMMKKTDPETGDEDEPYARAIAQILTAYNLAVSD